MRIIQTLYIHVEQRRAAAQHTKRAELMKQRALMMTASADSEK